MAFMKNSSNNLSSSYGEAVARQANVLASCYIVDPSAALKGFHYCTTLAAGAECPPLAAITSSNQLALTPKPKKRSVNSDTISRSRRGEATLQIREECERFFCETLASVFQVEGNMGHSGHVLTGVHTPPHTPPEDFPAPESLYSRNSYIKSPKCVTGWMEVWDYVGGASFRAFTSGEADDKSLFAFFDVGLMGHDLKQALMAMMELAEGPLACSKVVICVDRFMPEEDTTALMRSLQWVGFELTTLDHWASDVDVTSDQWIFMGMDV